MNIVLIGLFGSLGVLSRYTLGQLIPLHSFYFNPTLISNFLGCFIFGLVAGYFDHSKSTWALYVLIGFCGGLTTFSSFAMEIFNYIKLQSYLSAVSYTLISTLAGVGILSFGYLCSQTFSK